MLEPASLYECLQNSLSLTEIGQEDCLYLYIYVPRSKPIPNENLDIIIHIHGGAFMFGSAKFGGPEYLMDKEVISVALNYRVGVMGFLTTLDDDLPGNNGLKDQLLALKWLKKNIHNFGGNPDSITVSGFSAGAASLQFHLMSPLSKGLINKGMMHSGTALAPWALQKSPIEKAKLIAATVGCDTSSSKIMADCLRKTSTSALIASLSKVFVPPGFPIAPLGPVIEKPSPRAFLTDHPYKILQRGEIEDIPLISSGTEQEGTLELIMFESNLNSLRYNYNYLIPHMMDYNYTVKEADKPLVAKRIKEFYFKNNLDSPELVQYFVKAIGDRNFEYNREKVIRMLWQVNKSPIYNYVYGYVGEHEFYSLYGIDSEHGVGHGEDIALMFFVTIMGITLREEHLTESDEYIKDILIDNMISFAKTGKPQKEGIKWEPCTPGEEMGFLYIKNKNNVSMVYKKHLSEVEFLESLPFNDDTYTYDEKF